MSSLPGYTLQLLSS